MMTKTKKEIKAAVLGLYKNFGYSCLPVPVKSMAKSLSNCRLVPYSKVMEMRNLSYNEVITLMDTEDACTDYHAGRNEYIIYYNDLDKNRFMTYRYRWSIAHELGHVVLGHHKNSKKTRIYRNALSDSEYNQMELEADTFAAYLLVPHILLDMKGVHSPRGIANACKISHAAAESRYEAYVQWKEKWKPNRFDKHIKWLFYSSPNIQPYIYCDTCGTRLKLKNRVVCHVCGGKKVAYKPNKKVSYYLGIKVDRHAKAEKCHYCGQSMIGIDRNVCPHCSHVIRNICMGDALGQRGPCQMSQDYPLTGDARYCPYCGSKTTFYEYNVLPQWNKLHLLPC